MKSLLLVSIIVVSFLMSNAFAQTFESIDDENYLFLEISDNEGIGILRIDGKIVSFQSDIKYYKNGNFRLNIFDNDNRIILFGNFANNFINIWDLKSKEKITLAIHELDVTTTYEKTVEKELTPLEKFELAEIPTGMIDIRAQEELERLEEEKKKLELEANKTVISRSQYVESEKQEIKILSQIMERIPYYQEFFFDIRIVDKVINGVNNDFWNDSGFINDAEVTSIIRDPQGIILNEFAGNTTGKGVYAPENGTPFYYNSVMPGSYTLQVNATKYFDESATFATDSIVKEFFVFIPSDSNSSSQTSDSNSSSQTSDSNPSREPVVQSLD